MKTSARLISGLLALLILAVSSTLQVTTATARQSNDPDALLERAKHAELVQGDLDQAIAIYRQVSESSVAERSFVAQALLGLGQAYETMGNPNATNVYSRIVREYADQSDVFLMARTRLSEMGSRSEAPITDNTALHDAKYSLVMPNLPMFKVGTRRLYDVSPDGRQVVMTVQASDERVKQYPDLIQDLVVVDMFTGLSRPLLADPGSRQFLYFPRWSPDGRFILYHAHRDFGEAHEGNIYLFDTETETTRRLPPSSQDYTWFPDSNRFLVPGADGLHVYGIDGQERQFYALPMTLRGRASTHLGSISPNGQWVTYSKGEKGNRDIWIFDFRTSESTRVTTDLGYDDYATWSLDGSSLYFTSNRDRSEVNIYQKRVFSDSEPVQITSYGNAYAIHPIVLRETGKLYFSFLRDNEIIHAGSVSDGLDAPAVTRGTNPQLSPDGKRIYFVSHDQDRPVLWSVRIGETDATPVLKGLEGRRMRYWLSPDGSEVCYSRREGSSAVLYGMPSSGGRARIVVSLEGVDYVQPDWSPDGSEIVFADQNNLYVMPSSGGEKETLVSDIDWERWTPTWSPDGSMIAALGFQDGSESNFVFVVDRSTKEVRRLTTDKEIYIEGLSWNPDGKHLSFMSYGEYWEDGGDGSFQVSVDGGPVTPLVNMPEPLWDYVGLWGPDRRYYFENSVRGLAESGILNVFDPISGQATPVRDQPMHYTRLPVWSRDGSTIAWQETEYVRQLWMLTDYE